MNRDELQERNKAVVEELFRLCNVMGNGDDLADLINEHIQREHRTITQSFFGVLKRVIDKYADTSANNYDLRNEQSASWAKVVAAKGNEDITPQVDGNGRGFSFLRGKGFSSI